jgi:hypothetical protein
MHDGSGLQSSGSGRGRNLTGAGAHACLHTGGKFALADTLPRPKPPVYGVDVHTRTCVPKRPCTLITPHIYMPSVNVHPTYDMPYTWGGPLRYMCSWRSMNVHPTFDMPYTWGGPLRYICVAVCECPPHIRCGMYMGWTSTIHVAVCERPPHIRYGIYMGWTSTIHVSVCERPPHIRYGIYIVYMGWTSALGHSMRTPVTHLANTCMQCTQNTTWPVVCMVSSLQQTKKAQKAYSTSTSRVVPHHSTTLAVHRLTSRFGWDVVYSASCGRKRQMRVNG